MHPLQIAGEKKGKAKKTWLATVKLNFMPMNSYNYCRAALSPIGGFVFHIVIFVYELECSHFKDLIFSFKL